MRRDWADLNPELLHLISKKLEDLSNFIRFRAVCKQWRSTADPADPPPLLPLILQPNWSCDQDWTRTVSSFSFNAIGHVKLQITPGEYMDQHNPEPSMGFILVNGHKNCKPPYLYNPLTGTKIHLPFSKNTQYIKIYLGPDQDSNSNMEKDGVILVVYGIEGLGVRRIKSIGVWRSDNNKFISHIIPEDWEPPLAAYYKGKLFIPNRSEETIVLDNTTEANMQLVIPNPTDCPWMCSLVEAAGDLLLVNPILFLGGKKSRSFKVYRLEHTDNFEQCRWVELKGIGDRVLFYMGPWFGGFCLRASDFKGLGTNCIIYQEWEGLELVLRYNMEDGTSELLDHIPPDSTWFLPSLTCIKPNLSANEEDAQLNQTEEEIQREEKEVKKPQRKKLIFQLRALQD
jgi:Protein of unknown function (DUF295)